MGAALDVVFSPDGQSLLTASAQGGARLWKISSQNFARWAWPQGQPVERVEFSPDGKRVAVCSLNEITRFLPRGVEERPDRGFVERVTAHQYDGHWRIDTADRPDTV
jgi:WD40 repeat protein